MPEKSINAVSADLRELYKKGNAALQRNNLDYAIAIFQQVLVKDPAFFDCRQALRATQFKKVGGQTSFFKKMLASASPLLAKGNLVLRKNPAEAIEIAEQILSREPTNTSAHRLLAEAAMAADLPKTAMLSLEIALKNAPKDYQLSMSYGQALAQAGEVTKAEAVYVDLIRAYPQKGEVGQALKDLSARKSLDEGGFGGGGSYRDMLRDKEEATSLEQQSKQIRSEDSTRTLITDYETRLAQEPDNLKLVRSLAELYSQRKDYQRALEYYQRIRAAAGGDPSLEKAIAETQLKRFDQDTAKLDPNAADYGEEVERMKGERLQLQLAETKGRVERYPTDLSIRYELGELYFQAGQISEAIQEFQKAQSNPNRRLQAMTYLGQCFAHRGMFDMAARKFQDAIKEKIGWDDQNKELHYQLGTVLEKMEKREEAIEQFKLVYEVDIGYKDVAEKVDKYYSGG